MNDSRRRLVILAVVYLFAALGLLLLVGHTMIVEHEDWLRRSYTNRWAFRDVPTKRGDVRDRRGNLLVYDRPTSALEVHYREFRRRHPCGVAWHGANLLLDARGKRRLPLSPAGVTAAFEICLSLQFDSFRELEHDPARDLRFYLTSLLASLTDESRSRLGGEIRKSLDGGRGSIVQNIGLDRARLREVFSRRLAELEEIAALLLREDTKPPPKGIPARSLWDHLRLCEERRLKKSSSELVARRMQDGLAYVDARRIARSRERHPGFHVRPSVARQKGAVEARWETLESHVGFVTAEWGIKADEKRRAKILAELSQELDAMALADEGLPEELRSSVSRRLRGAMAAHMESQGRVGRGGVERDQDSVLRGTAGMHWVLRGRRRRDMGLWSNFDVTPGNDVYLTVDLRLQHLLEHAVDEALGGREGQLAAIAIIDPNTGDVLALASRPSRKDRMAAKRKLPDPAISWSGTWFIGSLAKPLLLAEHLDARRHGRLAGDPMKFDECRGSRPMKPNPDIPFRRRRLRCDHIHGTHVDDCVYSLGESCNYFFFQVGEGLRWEGVRRAYERFGLYREPGKLDAARKRGKPPPASKWFQAYVPGIPASTYPDPVWQLSDDIQRRSIGYFVEANVLQMVRAYAGIATGRLPELSLVRRRPEHVRSLDLGLHPDDVAIIHEGMLRCTRTGTARKLNLDGVWAKTGTAEISKKRLPNGGIRTTNNAWLAGFVGRAPAKLAFACVVYNTEEGGFGATVAGPMFRNFLRELRANPKLAKDYL